MMVDTERYDFAVIGGGSAGYAAARTAVEAGLKTVVIDGAEELGGLCILRGCMPSKTLIESANRALSFRGANEFGLHANAGQPDIKFIRDRKRRLIRDFASYRQGQLADGRFDLLRGMASFESSGDDELAMAVRLNSGGGQQLRAKTVLIATGSAVHVPEVPGLRDAGFWTSDDVLDASALPGSFIVLGGGAIALEMAHYLDAMGRKVTVLQRNTQLLTGMDVDVAEVVHSSFVKRGVEVCCGTRLECIEKSAAGKIVVYEHGGKICRAQADEILLALGRRPALIDLGLSSAGIELTESGHVRTGETQITSHPRVFAAGDVCGPLEVVHLAIQQGETAARNAAALLGGGVMKHKLDYRGKLFGIFTQPQVAAMGITEQEAARKGIPVLVAMYPFNDHGKSIVMGETEGFVKLIASPEDGLILGGAVAGPEATELIHEISVAMHLGGTVFQLASAPHYHPTLSEIWTYPAEEIAGMISPQAEA